MESDLELMDEQKRLAALYRYEILDTPPEAPLDDLTALAATLCETPMACISLLDHDRLWCKSCHGLTVAEFARDDAFYAHVIGSRDFFLIRDILADARFAANPFVLGDSQIRFYAGSSLVTPDGHIIGVLCVLDRAPRTLNLIQQQALQTLGRQVMVHLELRRQTVHLTRALTESTQAYKQLHQSEAYLRSILENTQDLISILNPDGTTRYVSPSHERVLGYSPGELVGQNAFTFIHPDDASLLLETFQRGLAIPGYTVSVEFRHRHKDGSWRTLEGIGKNLLQDPEVAGVLVNSRDISVRKRAEEALTERARLVALGADVGVALTQSDSLHGLLQHSAEALVRRLDAALARIWTLNEAQQVLELQASAGLHTDLDSPDGRVSVGRLTIGRIVEERKPYLTNAVIGDPWVSDQEWAKREQIVAFVGYPLIIEGRLVGVMAVFAHHTLTDFTFDALAAVANEIALGIERKRAEEALQESEARFRAIFEGAGIGIGVFDMEGQVVESNQALQEMLGYDREELRGLVFPTFTHPDDVEMDIALYTDLVLGERNHYQIEKRYVRRDGKEVWGRLTMSLVRKAEGSPEFAVGMVEDISERKRAEEALRQEAHITAALAGVGRELIAALNTPALLDRLCEVTVEVLGCDRSSILFWQPQEQGYTITAGYGYTAEQWEMLRALKLSRKDFESVSARLEAGEVVEVTADTLQSRAFRAIFHALDTKVALWLGLWQGQQLIGCQIVAYQGQPEFTLSQQRIAAGIAQLASVALTNATLFAELERANRLKGDFLATMSHELRTPLNAIMGYTDLTLEGEFGPLTAEQHEALQTVKSASERELALIIAMLDVNQLEAGRLPVNREAVDVVAFMEELREETQRKLVTKPQVGLIWRIPPGLPQLRTDRTKLRGVLQNLVSNAVKFTKQGSVTVEVHPADGGIEFRVTDTGIGITPEVQPVMFEMFRQGDSSATRPYEGTGLGLYVVRQMLELLGGTITVDSVEGKGSTFCVWIPAQE